MVPFLWLSTENTDLLLSIISIKKISTSNCHKKTVYQYHSSKVVNPKELLSIYMTLLFLKGVPF